ncbi:MAG TPA: cytochrome C oxidase subunit IV family protein [Leptospiraceae bacterium]|nr:cytochrome C oxidase subunit IV family protein [Leptospiraceae bacterium]HMW05570.1 cytochrome C oxidase subunit IV family protein [Leptospiraceae bacterium]HMX34228.1 cytochrome C oxidase subunit IV family protein [Leptospiraceae bacterium]HMY31080.1 cytochrome C oxidase subunit IV family protein [Leptospiraceae bacterium]HMZ65280.1 cytochrome C oxidase subunit IV family protein [Leptospiraceae bacterium]
MEEFVNYGLYFIACVCVLVPLFGLGLAPGIIVNLEVAAILGTLYAQIVEKGLIKTLIKDKGDTALIKPMVPTLQNIQNTIDSIESGDMGKKEEKHDHEDHGHHIIPIPVYAGVLGILVLGTIITVGVAQIDFGAWNTVIAMFVATIKASFVLLYFMHLKYDNAMNRVIFGSGFFFLLILFGFSIVDILTRTKLLLGFTKF